jgi:hypothetical protein
MPNTLVEEIVVLDVDSQRTSKLSPVLCGCFLACWQLASRLEGYNISRCLTHQNGTSTALKRLLWMLIASEQARIVSLARHFQFIEGKARQAQDGIRETQDESRRNSNDPKKSQRRPR